MTYDAVVVGGGIVGCACAHSLSLDLEMVALITPGPIGGGATAAGMGHIVVMDDSEAQFALTKRSQCLWDELERELPQSAEFERKGTLWVAADEEEAGHLLAKRDFYVERGAAAHVLDGAELAKAEPNLRPGLAGALLVPGDSVVFPMPVAAWLLERAKEKGCEHLDGAARTITGTEIELESGERIEAGLVVNAAGDRAAELTPSLPVKPRKGHLAITDRYPEFVQHQLVEMGYLKSAHSAEEDSVAFNVQPRATGQLLIGSSRQFAGWNSEVDRRILGRMLDRALFFMPGLSDLNVIRTWTGFRAATPDKLPLIGPWPEQPDLWLATGHEGLGITTSLATGDLLADLVCGRTPSIDPTPYLPERLIHG